MTREQAIAIARAAAQKHPESYVTLRAEDFQPHEWVIAAILSAAKQPIHRPCTQLRGHAGECTPGFVSPIEMEHVRVPFCERSPRFSAALATLPNREREDLSIDGRIRQGWDLALLHVGSAADRQLISERAGHLNQIDTLLELLGVIPESSNIEDELDRAIEAARQLSAERVGQRPGTPAEVEAWWGDPANTYAPARSERARPEARPRTHAEHQRLEELVALRLVARYARACYEALIATTATQTVALALDELEARFPQPIEVSYAKAPERPTPLLPCGCAEGQHEPTQNHTSSPGFRVCALGWPLR